MGEPREVHQAHPWRPQIVAQPDDSWRLQAGAASVARHDLHALFRSVLGCHCLLDIDSAAWRATLSTLRNYERSTNFGLLTNFSVCAVRLAPRAPSQGAWRRRCHWDVRPAAFRAVRGIPHNSASATDYALRSDLAACAARIGPFEPHQGASGFRRPWETASAIPKATCCTHRTFAQPVIFWLSRRFAVAAVQLSPPWRFPVISRHRLPLEILSVEMSAGRCNRRSALLPGCFAPRSGNPTSVVFADRRVHSFEAAAFRRGPENPRGHFFEVAGLRRRLGTP